jgi:hypothetical protein
MGHRRSSVSCSYAGQRREFSKTLLVAGDMSGAKSSVASLHSHLHAHHLAHACRQHHLCEHVYTATALHLQRDGAGKLVCYCCY